MICESCEDNEHWDCEGNCDCTCQNEDNITDATKIWKFQDFTAPDNQLILLGGPSEKV